MDKSVLLAIIFLMFLPLKIAAVTPVHMPIVSIDTSNYEFGGNYIRNSFVPSPYTTWDVSYNYNGNSMIIRSFLKKNSNQYDLYSFAGRIGTSVIPIIRDSDKIITDVGFSCKMIDDDDSWESIVLYYPLGKYEERYYKVFDHDGTELLADSGSAFYGFDGNSTYVINYKGRDDYMTDSWRFRTNLASSSPSLPKTRAATPGLMRIYGQNDGNYRVTLSPSSGNQINFQMFDLLGKCVFSKKINNLTTPQSFVVPGSNVPQSPFIAKVSDKNGSNCKKQIPVR